MSVCLQVELQQAAGELRAQLTGVKQERDALSSQVAQLQEDLAQSQLSPVAREELVAVCQERNSLHHQLAALQIELIRAGEAAKVAAAERDRLATDAAELADAHRDVER